VDAITPGNVYPLITDNLENKELLIESAIKNVFAQMDADRKAQALKQLQGHMWKSAYANGTIKGHVYDDVVPAFDIWKSRGIQINIYSSGSISAQKLLFGYSDKGDLLNVNFKHICKFCIQFSRNFSICLKYSSIFLGILIQRSD
jgi:2,3-diketo-5-methylthio-1-phosphopentane phosphatase